MAIRLLPAPRRQAMEVVYAFCRAVDDGVDRWGGTGVGARRELDLWRRELSACPDGFPTHPIAVALGPVIRRFQIPPENFEAVIAGVEMDLEIRRYATFEELTLYCRRVASAVGLISIRVFGCRHPASARYAENLGIALQLTNILRDLKSDAQRDRIYLPQEDLKRFGYSEPDLAAGRMTESFHRLMAFESERARSFFQGAAEALRESGEGGSLIPAQIMGGVYARLLDRIVGVEYDVFSRRVTVPRREQIWIAARVLATGK